MLTNGEQGGNLGCHKQKCLKETPGSAEGRLLGLFQFLLYAAFSLWARSEFGVGYFS